MCVSVFTDYGTYQYFLGLFSRLVKFTRKYCNHSVFFVEGIGLAPVFQESLSRQRRFWVKGVGFSNQFMYSYLVLCCHFNTSCLSCDCWAPRWKDFFFLLIPEIHTSSLQVVMQSVFWVLVIGKAVWEPFLFFFFFFWVLIFIPISYGAWYYHFLGPGGFCALWGKLSWAASQFSPFPAWDSGFLESEINYYLSSFIASILFILLFSLLSFSFRFMVLSYFIFFLKILFIYF